MRKQTSKPVASWQSGDDGEKAHENENDEMTCSREREKAAIGGLKRAGQNEREKTNSKMESTWISTSFILGRLGLMNLNYANIEEYKEPLSVKWFRM